MQSTIAIVDPFSSGNLLAEEAKSLGYQCVSIFSGEIEEAFIGSYIPEDYIANLIFSGDYQTLISELKSFEPIAVIVGCESGVELSDQLSNDLNLPCNEITLSPHRRDKYLMQKRIGEKNLRHIRQKNCINIKEVLKFSKTLKWPVVIKPLKSAGTDNVFICYSENDLIKGSQTILESNNVFGEKNKSLLVQEYIEGSEYAIDLVSHSGEHFVTNITKITKEEFNGCLLYKQVDFIPTDAEELQPSIQYVYKVLDALGLILGPSHCEIKIDDTGPVLIEVGARMHGGMLPKVVSAFAKHSQIDLCIDAYLRPKVFKKKTQQSNTYLQHAKVYLFINKSSGIILEVNEDRVASLPSYHWGIYLMIPGKRLPQTTSFINCPGLVYLLNSCHKQLQRDIDTLNQWEKEGKIYKIAIS
ncbi:MAG: ATP-grasp domain-containing protein [Colwellia sp.]